MSIIIFLIILLVLVISHEFGHFFVAKKSGIRVDEFSFGFPPKLFGVKKGETSYNFNALPFGGYVKIYGENGEEENSSKEDEKRSFNHKPFYIKIAVLLAGVFMNFIVAWLLISFGFMSGLPTSAGSVSSPEMLQDAKITITSVEPGSPAEISGLKPGDKLILLEGKNDKTEIPSAESIKYFLKRHSGEEIKISYIRGKELNEVNLKPIIKDNVPIMGVSLDTIGTLKLPVHKALFEGLKLSSDLLVATSVGFVNLIVDSVKGDGDISSVVGPIGIVGIVGDAFSFGFVYLLSFTALISINLVVINLIPFPALDGGRILFLIIEKIKGSPIKAQVTNIVNMVGFGLLILLMVFITYHDILKIIKS